MKRSLIVLWILGVGSLSMFPLPKSPPAKGSVETTHLTVVDSTGKLSSEALNRLARQTQDSMDRVLAFWSADAGIARFGKIKLVLDKPRRDVYSCVFFWESKGDARTRVVQVFGTEGSPQMLAHKLTSAIFPNPDKLIRNIMGTLAEEHVGNPLTFPSCGLSSDDWVVALLRSNAYIPLSRLGPDHESWGMGDSGGGKLVIHDKDRQHRAYAEAGSFGSYLFKMYGMNKIKQFHRQSYQKERPWLEVFGLGMDELEKRWLAAIQETAHAESVSLILKLRDSRAESPCAEAQRRSPRKP